MSVHHSPEREEKPAPEIIPSHFKAPTAAEYLVQSESSEEEEE